VSIFGVSSTSCVLQTDSDGEKIGSLFEELLPAELATYTDLYKASMLKT
jgi:hypothetical protein